MNTPIRFVLAVLRDNINLNNNIVPVVKRPYPTDKTPCITLDDSGGSSTLSKELLDMGLPVSSSHPQYDSTNPNKLFAQQVIRTKHSTTLNLNIWCNSETERESINNQVLLLFNKAFADYYTYCSNYDKSTTKCSSTNTTCEAISDTGTYGIKGQCPSKNDNDYENIFTKYDIEKASFNLEEPFSLDDFGQKPKLLRSIFKIRMNYYTDYVIGGTVTNDYEYLEE